MIVEIAVICLIAKLKHLRLGYLFRTWTFYPILVSQIILVFFQATIFMRSTYFLPATPFVEFTVMGSFAFAMFTYKLYKPAIAGSLLVMAGSWLNTVALAQNGDKMPAFPTLSYLTGYLSPEFLMTADQLHTLGTAQTKLIFLTDYIDFGYCILSPGDILIHLFACFMLYALIRAVNLQYGSTELQSN